MIYRHHDPHATQLASRGPHQPARLLLPAALALAALLAPALPVAAYDLAVAIQQGTANPVLTGAAVTYSVTLRNSASGAPSRPHVRVELPQGFTSATASGAEFSCTSSLVSASTWVNCTLGGSLASQQSRSLTVRATAPQRIAGDRQSFTVTARANPNSLGPEGVATANNTATTSTAVETAPDLDPTWTGSQTTTVAGNLTMFRLTLRNTGDRAAGESIVKVTLPIGKVSFLSFGNNQFDGGCSTPDAEGKLTCRTPSVPAGGSRRVDINTRANRLIAVGDTLLVSGTAELRIALPTGSGGRTSAEFRPLGRAERNEGNNTAFVVTTIAPSADLQVQLVRSTTISCFKERMVEVVVRVTSRGPGTATQGTQLRINGPDPCAPGGYLLQPPCQCYAATSASHHPNNCAMTATDQSCSFGQLSAGQSREFTLYVRMPQSMNSLPIEATVDPANVLGETNEQNNRVAFTHRL